MTETKPLSAMSPDEVAELIHIPVESWAQQCHSISLAIIQAGLVPGARVARGSCRGVGSQHSWIVDGWNCYDPDAKIIDPTLWSYARGRRHDLAGEPEDARPQAARGGLDLPVGHAGQR